MRINKNFITRRLNLIVEFNFWLDSSNMEIKKLYILMRNTFE